MTKLKLGLTCFLLSFLFSCIPEPVEVDCSTEENQGNIECLGASTKVSESQLCSPGIVIYSDCRETIPHSSSATFSKTCNAAGTSTTDSACTLISCEVGYEKSGADCLPIVTQNCTPDEQTNFDCTVDIQNALSATVTRTCNSSGTAATESMCTLNTCRDGYEPNGNSCSQIIVSECPTGEALIDNTCIKPTGLSAFISKWKISNSNERTITLPTRSGHAYSFFVDWGDGSPIGEVRSSDDANRVHTYANLGTYTVTVTGIAESWYFGEESSRFKIVEVIDLGHTNLTSLKSSFESCTNLTAFAGGNTSAVTDMSRLFYSTTSLVDIDLSSFDTSRTTDMSEMFYNVSALKSLNVSNFNTANVTDMKKMFYFASSLTELNISNFNTSNVTNMWGMLSHLEKLTKLDLSNFDTSKVTNMNNMLSGLGQITVLDVSSFNTSKVTNMTGMFGGNGFVTNQNRSNLLNLNLSNFDTSNVTNMSFMFSNLTSLTNLNISSFNTGKVTSMNRMFYNVSSLKALDLSHFDTREVDDLSGMFSSARSLITLDLSRFDTSKITDMSYMFFALNSLKNLNISNFDTSNVTTMNQMFSSTDALVSLNTNGWNINKVKESSIGLNPNSSLKVTCNQGGAPATGSFFGKTCF